MPNAKELLIVCGVAVATSLAVLLVMHLIGLEEHAVIAAAVSGGASAATVTSRTRSCAPGDEAGCTGN